MANSSFNFGQSLSSLPATRNTTVNPFARALAETEKHRAENPDFSQLESTVINNQDFSANSTQNQKSLEKTAFDAEALKKEKLRLELHRKINPVEEHDVFNYREQQVKKEIDDIRQSLKELSGELKGFYKEIDLTLNSNIASPGETGAYHLSFFQKLRAWILLLLEKVRSARTWYRVQHQKKQRQQHGFVLDFSGNETKAVHDMSHHERSNAFVGA